MAILQDKPDTKILVVTLSNDSSNVAMQKVWEQAKEIAAIANHIYLRGHKADVKCNYNTV
jgi:HD-like signal output (HDOD) protein